MILRLVLTFAVAVTVMNAAVDSVSMGPGYANQVWYQPGIASTSSPQSSWHLGFQSGVSATIIANDALVQGAGPQAKPFKVYVVPNSTPATYTSVDTTGMSAWTQLYNKPATWTGALNTPADASNIFDYGWGKYNVQSHQLAGERVFVVSMPDGSFWKLFVQTWSGFNYSFKYARLDGSDEHTGDVNMNGIVPKEFIYWSFDTHSSIDREPPSDLWDLTFLKYTEFISAGPGPLVPYPVVGVLAKPGIKLAKVTGDTPSLLQPPNRSEFDTTANVIGYDWKSFNQTTSTWKISDSTAYFILRQDGSMWKLVMTGFTGGSTGTTHFDADVVVTSVADASTPNANVLGVYPNVIGTGDIVNVVYDVTSVVRSVRIVDVAGRTVRNIALGNDAGMYVNSVSTVGMAAGLYRVVVETPSNTISSALVIR
ncbi:MAG: T9SS type A sorting domain-containing protein [bacterium]|nr:T9SS type A sorting domain-containing protein [bacterium]